MPRRSDASLRVGLKAIVRSSRSRVSREIIAEIWLSFSMIPYCTIRFRKNRDGRGSIVVTGGSLSFAAPAYGSALYLEDE